MTFEQAAQIIDCLYLLAGLVSAGIFATTWRG